MLLLQCLLSLVACFLLLPLPLPRPHRTYECRCVLPLLHSTVCLVLGDVHGPGALFRVRLADLQLMYMMHACWKKLHIHTVLVDAAAPCVCTYVSTYIHFQWYIVGLVVQFMCDTTRQVCVQRLSNYWAILQV